MGNHLTPVAIAEALFNGPNGLADALNMSSKAPYVWRREAASRRAGDFPSLKVVRDVRAAAAARGIDLPVAWLVYGAPEAEVSALLAAAQTQVAAE